MLAIVCHRSFLSLVRELCFDPFGAPDCGATAFVPMGAEGDSPLVNVSNLPGASSGANLRNGGVRVVMDGVVAHRVFLSLGCELRSDRLE